MILFRRGRVVDHRAFNAMIARKMAASPVPGLIVYPEGHRSTAATSLPLKRGMLQFAYGAGLPVQIVMGKGKEAVLSEKDGTAGWGRTVIFGYAEPLLPAAYPSFDAFFGALQAEWDAQWARVAAATDEGVPGKEGSGRAWEGLGKGLGRAGAGLGMVGALGGTSTAHRPAIARGRLAHTRAARAVRVT